MTRSEDENDVSEVWRDLRASGQAIRANNRESSTALLKEKGVAFDSRNFGAHLIVKHGGKNVDFWPGTGKWVDRDDRSISRRGLFPLLKYLGVR